MRGLRLHVVQYNIFKDSESMSRLETIKEKLLIDIKEKGLGSFYSFPLYSDKKERLIFERLEGLIEDLTFQLTSLKSESEKTELVARCYAEEDVFGDFNCNLPIIEVKVLCDTEGTIGVLCEGPTADLTYRNHKRVTRAEGVSLLLSPKRSSASVIINSIDINTDAKEVKGVINLLASYIHVNSIVI